MQKKWIGCLLLLVLSTQVFPVDGIRFWSNLFESEDQVAATSLLAIEEEEVEQTQLTLKHIDSNQAHFYERLACLSNGQSVYNIVPQLGSVIDRNDPIFIPPPNAIA